MKVTPIHEAHQPGWTRETPKRIYMLWAPRPATERHKARPQWAASWTDHDGDDGDFRRADTFDEAVSIFPGGMQAEFRTAATGHLTGPETTP